MVVYMYERLSDNVHRWTSPSDRDPYNATVFTSLGYIVLQPDIVFCDIETAFIDGKTDDVAKLVQEAKALKKEGHKKYIEEE